MEKLEILKAQLKQHLSNFEAEAQKHKLLYRRIRYSVFFLTALSTVLAGLAAAIPMGPWINIAVVAVTASIGVITSIDGLRKPAELWLNERSIFHGLADLNREVEFHSAGKPTLQEIEAYFDRAQALLAAGSAKWKQNVLPATPAAHPPQGLTPEVAKTGG